MHRLFYYVKLSVRNLGRTPRRTLISVSAIAFATTALLVFESFVAGVKKTFRHNVITSEYGHYRVYKKGYLDGHISQPFDFQLSENEAVQEKIATLTEGAPRLFSSRQEFFGLLSLDDVSVAASGLGIEADKESKFLTLYKIVDGKSLAETSEDGIVIGKGLAKKINASAGKMATVLTNTKTGSLNALDLPIVGIFKSGVYEIDDYMFHMRLDTARKLLRVEGSSYKILGLFHDDERPYDASLRSTFQKDFPDLDLKHWHDLMGDYYDNAMGWVENQYFVFRVIIFIIAILSISNVFIMSIMERTGEFGTLRALGTYRGELVFQILTESFLQAVVGIIIGLTGSVFIILVALRNGYYMPPPPNMSERFLVAFEMPWHSLPLIAVICFIISIVAGIYPALKISRLNIATALGRNV